VLFFSRSVNFPNFNTVVCVRNEIGTYIFIVITKVHYKIRAPGISVFWVSNCWISRYKSNFASTKIFIVKTDFFRTYIYIYIDVNCILHIERDASYVNAYKGTLCLFIKTLLSRLLSNVRTRDEKYLYEIIGFSTNIYDKCII